MLELLLALKEQKEKALFSAPLPANNTCTGSGAPAAGVSAEELGELRDVWVLDICLGRNCAPP